jgi:hypothetical protein
MKTKDLVIGGALLALLGLGFAAEKAVPPQAQPLQQVQYTQAAVDPVAYGFTVALIYHSGCEKLPLHLMYSVVLEMKKIPDSVLIPANEKVHAEMTQDGSGAAWCARIKPNIWKRIKEYQ